MTTDRVFLDSVLGFLGISITLYAVAQLYMYISNDTIIKPTVRCKYCKKFIGEQVCIPVSYLFSLVPMF